MAKFKAFPRLRRPSLNTALGISQAKRRIKKATGIPQVQRVVNTPRNTERRILRRAGYYSEPMKLFRFLERIFKKK